MASGTNDRTGWMRAAFLIALVVLASGCAGLRVQPQPGSEVAALEADDVVAVLLRGGFSDEEILEIGPDLRNALALNGGAVVRNRKVTEAVLAVHEELVHVSTRRRGTFIYNIESNRFR